jgi:DNA (cytosine-5)-methyltransferase 1
MKNQRMNRYTAIDLFCGAGGLTVGLRKAGFNVIAGVELDVVAAETYLMNHQDHVMYRSDIRSINVADLMRELGLGPGDLDLLAGCPPCQGFSTHRTRNKSSSVDDHRNDLVFEFLRFVKELMPKTIMMENVPGLAKDARISKFKAEIKKLGYQVGDSSVAVKDAADFCVPQRRKRMILQASRYGLIEHPKPTAKKKTVRDALAKLTRHGESRDILHDLPEKRHPRILSLIKLIPKDGGSRTDLPQRYWLPCHKRNPGSYRDVYGRMSWDEVAPTMTGGCHNPSKGRFLHPEEDRAITLREAALLQTFPKSYKFSLRKGKEAIALMIGNALPPEFIRRHALQFVKHLESLPKEIADGRSIRTKI